MTSALSKEKLSIKAQTLGAIVAIVAAVAIPQLLHVLGKVSNMGTALGETYLPMHLPIILAGLLAGPYAAGIAGILGPVISHFLTAMPAATMLPFMAIELCIYGISAGLLRNVKMPTVLKVLISQIAGRLIRGAAILIAFYAFSSKVKPAVIYKSIPTGLFGILLQLLIIPLVVYRLRKVDNE